MRRIAVRLEKGWAYGIKNSSNKVCDVHQTSLWSGPQTYCNEVHSKAEVDAAPRYPLKDWEEVEEAKRLAAV